MKRTTLAATLLALLVSISSSSAATKENILDLLPPGTPIVIVNNSPADAADTFNSLAGLSGDREGTVLDDFFTLLGLEKAPGGLNVNGPAALAMPQFPFPLLVVTVSDYELFLDELRAGSPTKDSPPPVSPAPGIDAINLRGKPVFMRREGDLALLTPMALLLAQPSSGTGFTASLHPDERAVLSGSGTYIRFDVAMLLAFAEPMLQQFLASTKPFAPPVPEGREPSEEEQAQELARNVLQAEVELLLAGLRQVRALSIGLSGTEKGSTLQSVWVPQPESGFASLLAEPTNHGARGLLRYFDDQAFFTGAFDLKASAFKGMVRKMTDFMFRSGIYNLSPEERVEWQNLVDTSFDAAGDRSAFSMGPSTSGGFLSVLALAEVKDAQKMRKLMQDSFAVTEKMMASSPMMAGGTDVKVAQSVETYRNIPIDMIEVDIRPPEAEKDPDFDAYMEHMFGGPSLRLWFAFHGDRMYASYYNPTSEGLKALLDRVLDDVDGTLIDSASFREATAPLPDTGGFHSYYSVPRMAEAIVNGVMTALPGKAPSLSFELGRPAGFGSAWYSSGDTLRTQTFMPKAELKNYRIMFERIRSMGTKSGSPEAPRGGEQQP